MQPTPINRLGTGSSRMVFAESAEERSAAGPGIKVAQFVEVFGKAATRALGLLLVVARGGEPLLMRCHRTCSFVIIMSSRICSTVRFGAKAAPLSLLMPTIARTAPIASARRATISRLHS